MPAASPVKYFGALILYTIEGKQIPKLNEKMTPDLVSIRAMKLAEIAAATLYAV